MTVKDVVKATATFLGRENIIEYLDGATADNLVLSQVNTLTRLTNLVIYELACSFIPMVKTENVESNDGKVWYSSLSETPCEILNAYDQLGKEISFTVKPEFLQTNYFIKSVEYKYLPSAYGLEDKIGYDERTVSPVVLAYGVTAEYLLTQKAFEQSVMWHERFTEGVNKICAPKNARIRERRFI